MRAPDKTRYLNTLRHVENAKIPFFAMEIAEDVARSIAGLARGRWLRLPVEPQHH